MSALASILRRIRDDEDIITYDGKTRSFCFHLTPEECCTLAAWLVESGEGDHPDDDPDKAELRAFRVALGHLLRPQ
jgi:hypothetical protein